MNRMLSLMFALSVFGVFAEGSLDKPKWQAEIMVPGVTYYHADVDDPKALRLNAVKIDLKAPGIFFTGTEKCPGYGEPLEEARTLYAKGKKKIEPSVKRTALESTPAFFERCSRPVEKGGRGLDMLVAFGSAEGNPPYSKGYACPSGLTISDGVVVSDVQRGKKAILLIRKDGSGDLVEKLSANEYPSLVFARSGYTFIRKEGKDIAPAGGTIRGRLAAGLTADRRYLYIITADTGDIARVGNDGVDYHQLNTLFEGFGVADAAAFSHGRNCELVVKDRKNPSGRSVNGYDAPPAPVQVNTGIYRVDPKAAAEKKRREENPVEVKFATTPRLNLASDSSHAKVLKGQVKLNFTTDLPRIKRPMLNVIGLFDYNGTWRYYDVLCCDPNESYGILAVKQYNTQQYSNWQPEVDSETWKTIAIGSPKSAFFAGYGIPDKAKLLLYRLEVWQGGKVIGEYESDPKAAKKLGLPDDWYVKGKHEGKIVYKYPPEEKKK